MATEHPDTALSRPAADAAPGPLPGEAAAERIIALRREFAATLGPRFAEIEGLRRALISDPERRRETLDSVLRRCHDLAGSAASFGFQNLSDIAASAELAIKALTWPPEVGDLDMVTRQLDQLLAQPQPDPASLGTPPQWTAPQTLAPRAEPRASGPGCIYIVDDNLLVAEQLATQLRYFGFEVAMFGRLDDFAAAYRAEAPALVLLDIDFPEEDQTGPAIYRQLIADTGRAAPVIFVSGHDDVGYRLEAVRAGGVNYLAKPVNVAELVDVVDRLLHPRDEEALRVLIVDDSEAMCQLHATILAEAGMKVRTMTDPLAILDALSEFQPDLLLIDLYMPACQGNELAAVVRQIGPYVTVPIVFLSSEADRMRQLEALAHGADDFLVKPVAAEHLVACVRNRCARARRMRTLVKNDSLTGLLNHISFLDAVGVELARARRAGQTCALAMLDLDHFKSINDTHGHPAGDRVLTSIARQLRQRLRNVDLIGRYGGEEFAVMISAADGRAALRVINGIREDFARIQHSSAHGPFTATFSAGVATFPDFQTVDQLVEAADKGLYEAKRRGRNCAVYVTPPPRRTR